MVHSELLVSLVAALVAAFIGGFVAVRLHLPPIVGYLLAGVAIGPFTPGGSADPTIAAEMAEVGVILLMFGVGLHFSLKDLLAVRAIAVPGAVGQITVATALGLGLALAWGWAPGEGLVLGLAIAVASTVVLLRALEDRGVLDSVPGHVAIGWLIVEDLFTVLVLVLLPALAVPLGGQAGEGLATAGGDHVALVLALALAKAAVFVVLMLYGGTRAVPWLLAQVARTGSRELFTLGVLAIALGIAFAAAELFGVSLALGAFLAGVVLAESDLSHQAANDALPMRDAFAVLFFVSVGMLFDPAVLLEAPGRVAAIVAIVVVGKALAAFGLVAIFGYPVRTGLTVGAGLAQVGEFSFILISLGAALSLFPPEGQSLVLATALLSITLNPLLFRAIDPVEAWLRGRPRLMALLARQGRALTTLPADDGPLRGHAVLCGHGRVGRIVAEALELRGFRYVVIEENRRVVEALRAREVPALYGDAGSPTLLGHAGLGAARVLVVAIPDAAAVRQVVAYARAAHPRLPVVVRTHSETERDQLRAAGVGEAVLGEQELALELTRYTLQRFGVSANEVRAMLTGLRRRSQPPAHRRPALAEE
jgi:monovalent cation:H+ antiporter-2, CPA2 family